MRDTETGLVTGHHCQPVDGTALEDEEQCLKTDFCYPDDDGDRGNPMAGIGKETGIKVAAIFLEVITQWIGDSKTTNACGVRAYAMAWLLRRSMFTESTQRQFCKNRNIVPQQLNHALRELRSLARGQFRVTDRMWPEDSCEALKKR